MRPLPLTSALLAAAFVGRATGADPACAPLDAAADHHAATDLRVGAADDSAAITTAPAGDGCSPAFVESGPPAARAT